MTKTAMTPRAKPMRPPSRQVKASPVHQIKLIRTPERPFDAVIQVTTAKGEMHFILPETAADELGRKLQVFAANALAPAGHA